MGRKRIPPTNAALAAAQSDAGSIGELRLSEGEPLCTMPDTVVSRSAGRPGAPR
jgi:hypothetical protein